MSSDIVDDALNEVLDIVQRQKRAQITRANQKKLEVARRVARGKMASQKNLKKRAYAQARKIVRRKFAGKRGEEYESLGPAEKMQIDKAVEGKVKIIKKIAARLLPRIQQAEAKRLASFMKGHQLQNLGANERKSMNEETNKKFGDKFKGKKAAKVASQIKIYNRFSEEVESKSGIYKSLAKKADKAGLDIGLLGEVFDRGLESWTEDQKVSRSQYAFARVNSYINQGKSYFNEDADLHENVNRAHKELSNLKKHLGFVHVGLKHFYDKEQANLEPKDNHKFKSQEEKISHIHKSLKKAGYKLEKHSPTESHRDAHGGHRSYWSSGAHNDVSVHVPPKEDPKKHGVTQVQYHNYDEDHHHKPDVHANLSDAGHENGQKIYNRELGHHAIKESLEEKYKAPMFDRTPPKVGTEHRMEHGELNKKDTHKVTHVEDGHVYFHNTRTKEIYNAPVMKFNNIRRPLKEELEEGKNTPSVKKIKGLSGNDTWKAMNKHGKTQFFNNPVSAHRHAGIPHEVKEEALDEISDALRTSYLKAAHKDLSAAEKQKSAIGKKENKGLAAHLSSKTHSSIAGKTTSQKASVSHTNAANKANKTSNANTLSNDEHKTRKNLNRRINNRHDGIGRAEYSMKEELGPENEIGTDAVVRKYRKGTPGQENAETHENKSQSFLPAEAPLKEDIIGGVKRIIHNTAERGKQTAGLWPRMGASFYKPNIQKKPETKQPEHKEPTSASKVATYKKNKSDALKEAASVTTNTADTKRVRTKTADGKVVWRNVRASRDIIKD